MENRLQQIEAEYEKLPTRMLKISDLQMPKTFYPRETVHQVVVDKYFGFLKAGAEFPPIKVGRLHNHNIVVDGWHRVHAFMKAKALYIPGKVKSYASEGELFADAVVLNSGHGFSLTKADRRRCARRLKLLKFKPEEIVKMINLPISEIVKGASEKEKVLKVTGPGGHPIIIPIQPNPLEGIRINVIDALTLTVSDDVDEAKTIIQTQRGKYITIPIKGDPDSSKKLKKHLNEALKSARVNQYYELAMILERAITILNGVGNIAPIAPAAMSIEPQLWEGPCSVCGMPRRQCICRKSKSSNVV